MEKFINQRNPILPLKYHIPDSEGHVMPDGRLYIYGSCDEREDVYCSDKYYVVSTKDMKAEFEKEAQTKKRPFYLRRTVLKRMGRIIYIFVCRMTAKAWRFQTGRKALLNIRCSCPAAVLIRLFLWMMTGRFIIIGDSCFPTAFP